MADKTLELTATYPAPETPGIDYAYSEREREIRWRTMLLDPEINPAAEAGPAGGTPEQVAAAGKAGTEAPREPMTGLPLDAKPSPIAAGASAAFQAAGEGARSAMEGLTRTILTRPQGGANTADEVARGLADKAGGVRQFLMEGVMGALNVPLAGISAGLRQTIENDNPEALKAEVLDGGAAGFVRMVTGQGNPLTEGKTAPINQPMTLGEAVDLAVMFSPMAIGGARKAVEAGRIQGKNIKGQRGSMGGEEFLNLEDPDSIVAFVKGKGGLKSDPAMRGEFARIPLDLKNNKTGQRWDVIAQQAGVDPMEFLNALTDLEGLRRQKRERQASEIKAKAEEWAGYDAKAPDAALAEAIDFWDKLGAESPERGPGQGGASGEGGAVPRQADAVARGVAGRPGEDPGRAGAGAGAGDLTGQALSQRAGAVPEGPSAAAESARGNAGSVGSSRPVGALNTDRINAPDTVKSIMVRLNEMAGAGERVQAHRATVSHEATIAAGKARGVNLDKLMRTDLESYLPDAAGQDALRNMYNAIGHVLDSLEQRIAMGDTAAQAEYISTQAIGMVLAVLDEAGARNVARSLEARKIGSEAERASMKDLASFARQLGAETGLTPEVDAGKAIAAKAQAAGRRLARDIETGAPDTFSVADLIAGKIGGELTLTTVAAELIRTAHGGTMPAKIAAAEVIAAKITAEFQAQQPHVGPEALMGVYKAIERAQKAAEDQQVREHDAVAATIANALAASGYVAPPTAMSLAEAVARKMALEMLAAPQTEQGVSPAAILAAMRAHLETEHQRRTWMGNWWAGIRAGASIGYSAWVQGLISGLRTSARNIIGMAISLPYEAPSRFTAEWVNKFITHDPEGVQRGETARALSQSFGAIASGIQLAGQAWRENKAPWEEAARERSKVAIFISEKGKDLNTGKAGRMDNSAAAWGFDPDTTFGGTIDVLNKALNSRWTPGGALIVEDAFAKGIAYHVEISALAVRNATREGLTSGTPEFRARVEALERSPLPQMVIDAQDHAILITMNKELGVTGQLGMRLMDRIPGARVLMPFVRWGTNAGKFVVQNTGLLGELSAQNYRDIGAGGALRDKAIARMILGLGTTGAIVAGVLNGNITASGMLSPVQRAMRPFREEGSDYAIKLGNVFVSGYNQWGGQAGLMVAAVADYVDLLRQIPDQNTYERWIAGLEGIALASGVTWIRQSSMQGLANMLDAMQDPERQAGKELKGLARSAVPTLVRDLTKTFDDNVIHETRGVTDAFKAGLPYFAQGIPAHRHQVTGEVLLYPASVAPEFLWPFGAFVNMVSPIGFTEQKDRAWAKEILANNVLLRPIGWNVSMSGFTTQAPADSGPQLTERAETGSTELTPAQRDAAIVYMTQTAKDAHGRPLAEALEHLVGTEQYLKQSKGEIGGRATRIRETYSQFRDRAHAWLLDPKTGSPTLKAQVLDAQSAKDNAKRPVTDPKSPQFNPGALLQSLGR